MSENVFLSYLITVDWSAALQWYMNHLNTAALIQALQQGTSFSHHDWQTFLVLNINIFILFSLVHLFILVHRKSAFHTWIQNKRSKLTEKPQQEIQARIEPKVTDSTCLGQAYNLHRFAMYDGALNKYKQAFHSHPDELNTYLVGIKIISEMDEPDKQFIHFFQTGIAYLRKKHPAIWQEVAKYGREKAPELDQWQIAA